MIVIFVTDLPDYRSKSAWICRDRVLTDFFSPRERILSCNAWFLEISVFRSNCKIVKLLLSETDGCMI